MWVALAGITYIESAATLLNRKLPNGDQLGRLIEILYTIIAQGA